MEISEDLLIKLSLELKKSDIGKQINDIIEKNLSDEDNKNMIDNTHTHYMLSSYLINEITESVLEDRFERICKILKKKS